MIYADQTKCAGKNAKGRFNMSLQEYNQSGYTQVINVYNLNYMIQVRALDGVLGLNQHNDYLKISLDKNIKGLRGFLVKRVDTPDNINRIKEYNMSYWPLNKTESQSS